MIKTVNGSGLENNDPAGTLYILTGDNSQFTLWKGGYDSVLVYGNNDTINQEYAGPNFIYDFTKNLNIEFTPEAYPVAPMTVYGFYQDPGAHVTLAAGQQATEASYRDGYVWGTKLTVYTPALGSVNTAYFAFTPHVSIVYESDTMLSFDHDDNFSFSGSDDTLTFVRSGSDTVTTTGTDQTVNLDIGSAFTIIDRGSGLNVEIGETVNQVTIEDFQNDPTARIVLALASQTATIAPDGYGGTLVVASGFGANTAIDLVGDAKFSAAQIVHA